VFFECFNNENSGLTKKGSELF